MPTSPAGKANNRPGRVASARGFTLIELLVVVTILSILALGVGFGAGGGFARTTNTPRAVADRLAEAMTRARDAALLGRASVGVVPRRDGWLLATRDADGAWQTVAAPVAASGVTLIWQVAGAAYNPSLAVPLAEATPPVLFLPDGRSTAFDVIVVGGGGQRAAQIACRTDGWEPVTCD
jgi:prepilin-type N-terminal cleavage/methylation domain-containing protein